MLIELLNLIKYVIQTLIANQVPLFRYYSKVYANEEDLSLGGEKTITDDADVERVRR